jgi:hypothetical protein
LIVEAISQQRELQHSFTSYSAGPEIQPGFFFVMGALEDGKVLVENGHTSTYKKGAFYADFP